MKLRVLCAVAVSLAAAAPVHAQQSQPFDLSVQNIMRGPELLGKPPQALRGREPFSWSPDSKWIWFRWQQPGVDTTEVVYRVNPRGGQPERFEHADPDTIVAGDAAWSHDRNAAVYALKGNLYLWTARGGHYLTRGPSRDFNPQWSADDRIVYFERNGNMYGLNIRSAELMQLTDIRRGNAPPEKKEPTGQRAFLTNEAHRLFDFISSGRYKNQPWNRRPTVDSTQPKPFYPGAHAFVSRMRITPDGNFVLMTITEQPQGARRVKMAVWITDDGYESDYTGRTKVGDKQATSRAAILEVATGKVTYVGDSVGTGGRDISGMDVSSNSKHALIKIEGRNHKDRWWAVVDLPDLTTHEVAHDHDDAWIGFPGPELPNLGGFLPDGETVWFGSERSHWAQLYLVPAAGGQVTPVTTGQWEVLSAELSPDGKTWYLETNRKTFAEVHFETVPVRGGKITEVTHQVGRQDVAVSPDGKWLAMSASVANHPPELYVQPFSPDKPMRKITESTTKEWRRGHWIKPEIVMVTARDGVKVPARLYRPTGNLEPMGHRPAVIFVHGAGYLQNVMNWWSGYSREYMFNHLLASKGYTVLDMDYRGSAGHGRDWRVAIYRHMGGKDLDDEVDGAKWLVKEMGIDSTRIGIYGGSYGGFMTLMAMFTKPGIFASGAALRPVSDWAHYNDPYTSAILNDPQDDSVAYVRSSPIYHVEGLQGNLLICHGLVDDNVLFYDTAHLVQRLIELGKDHWTSQFYPEERHGFTEIASWRDEYKRILHLFDSTIGKDAQHS